MRYPFLDLRKLNEPYMAQLEKAATRVIRSGRYIGGEEVDAFNAQLATILNAPHAIGVSNGLDALRLILRAYIQLGRMHAGDEIIVPANTYIASVLAITDCGLKPILVDPDITTMNLTGEIVARHLTPATRAIMPVHLYGRIAWDEEMRKTAIDHNLLVIEDAAQSIGAESPIQGLYSSNKAAALGHAGALSFYPTKNVGALGDAGAVITHDPQLAATVKALANYGSDRRYHNIYQGFNCRIDPMQAAMLSVKLPYINDENRARRQNAEIYTDTITHPDIITPGMPTYPDENVWHQYVIRVPADSRQAVRSMLESHGVGTDIHYAIPPHLQPCYANLPHGRLSVTEQLAGEIISLPITTATPATDITRIANIINALPPLSNL